jgi:hypothetical protein
VRHLITLLAIALVAASPCATSAPSGRWTFGPRIVGAPQPATSIEHAAASIVVSDFAGDRAFTSTTSRYDAVSLALLSGDRHASCCAGEWNATVTRDADGSYDVLTRQLTPGDAGTMKTISQRAHLPRPARPLVLGATPLLPWIYQVTHARSVDMLELPGPSRTSVVAETVDLAEADGDASPAGLAAGERGLRLTWKSKDSIVLWYDPCTFVVDAIQSPATLLMRGPIK